MPNQCVHCGQVYPDASKELLEGCSCGSHFFYYLRKMPDKIVEEKDRIKIELSTADKKKVEKDVRDIIGIQDEDIPVILDLESIKITEPGKYEIDVVNLFDKERPLIYKLDEGRYIIDLASTLKVGMSEISRKIKKPARARKRKIRRSVPENEKKGKTYEKDGNKNQNSEHSEQTA